MFIRTEETPNPASLKFLPGCDVMLRGTVEFRTKEEAGASPLARRLFSIDGVAGVFLGNNFVTVTKSPAVAWPTLQPILLETIMGHFMAGEAVMNEEEKHAAADTGNDDPLVRQIVELIDTRIRPVVAQDGGDVVFSSFDKGVVYLHMRGACAGCPGSTATLKGGIERMLKHFVPEVEEVRPV